MSTVVVSECYGGYGLSEKALREYLRRTGRNWTERPSGDRGLPNVFTVDGKDYWGAGYISRTDPVLAEIIRELGGEANSPYSNLVVYDVPDGAHYRIEEYDGYESLHLRSDDSEWSVA